MRRRSTTPFVAGGSFALGMVAAWTLQAVTGSAEPRAEATPAAPPAVVKEVVREVPAECPPSAAEPTEEELLRREQKKGLARLVKEVPPASKRMTTYPFKRKHGYRQHLRVVQDGRDVFTRLTRRKVLERLGGQGRVEGISPGDRYALCGATFPFLAPPAVAVLEEAADRFQRRVKKRTGIEGARFCVSSAARTSDFQRRLRRKNRNASRTSTHEWAAAFDISYKHGRFSVPPDMTLTPAHSDRLKTLLGEVLGEMQEEGRALVIYETGQPCFHVTAPPRPPGAIVARK